MLTLEKQPLFKDVEKILTHPAEQKTNLRDSIVLTENYIVQNLKRRNKFAALNNSGLLNYTQENSVKL